MSCIDKCSQASKNNAIIAENMVKIYEEGLKDGCKEEQEKTLDITENGTTEVTPDEGKALSKVTVNVAVGGGDSWYDTFWDVYQQNGTRKNYESAFYGGGWNESIFYPKYNLVGTSFTSAFRDITGKFNFKRRLIECGITLDTSQATSLDSLCRGSFVEELPILDFTKCSRVYQICNGDSSLHTVEKMIVKKDLTYNGPFSGCTALVNIVFEGEIGNSIPFNASTLLSDASVQNIIDHLVDLTGSTAQTLTLHADLEPRISVAQVAEITSKNWTLAYKR